MLFFIPGVWEFFSPHWFSKSVNALIQQLSNPRPDLLPPQKPSNNFNHSFSFFLFLQMLEDQKIRVQSQNYIRDFNTSFSSTSHMRMDPTPTMEFPSSVIADYCCAYPPCTPSNLPCQKHCSAGNRSSTRAESPDSSIACCEFRVHQKFNKTKYAQIHLIDPWLFFVFLQTSNNRFFFKRNS